MGEPPTSKLFTGADVDDTAKEKLQDCPDCRRREVASHSSTTANRSGSHIRLVQEALKRAQARDLSLKLPPFAVDGVYSKDFTDAVFAYKQRRNILNYAGRVDNIVDIKTIHSLDAEARGEKAYHHDFPARPGPKPVPRPTPLTAAKCVPEAQCPTSQSFEATIIMGGCGGDVFKAAKYWVNIRDTGSNLSSLYLLTIGGYGMPALRARASDGGAPKPFTTDKACKVCNFGPGGSFGQYTDLVLPTLGDAVLPMLRNVALMWIQFRTGDRKLHTTCPFIVHTGLLTIHGGDINVGRLENITPCGQDGIGARRGFFTKGDLAGIN